jgi:hypothetical protein
VGTKALFTAVCVGLAVIGITGSGCARRPKSAGDAYADAKALFEHVSKHFHIPSAEASGTEKLRLQNLALSGYQQLLQEYPAEDYWVAQALRSRGNIYSAQTNVDSAVKSFAAVEQRCPKRDWEILISWKSAGDLLWDAHRQSEARLFYGRIIERFDRAGSAQVVATIVRGSRQRLAEGNIGRAS